MFKKDLLITTINSLVFSKLYYYSSVWLQGVQNFAAHIHVVSRIRKFDHVTVVLKDFRWIPVKFLLYLRNAILTFKCMTGQAPSYLCSNFICSGNVSGWVTRNSQQLNIPLFKTKFGQRSFHYRVVTLWNELRYSLKLSESVSFFKHQIKVFLLNELILVYLKCILYFTD